jgi:predicted transposase/invertase (TIGR01784 family)
MGSGEDYPRLNQVIFVGILNFTGFEGDEYLSRHLILNQRSHQQEIEDLELFFIELPKFQKREDELTTVLDKWVYFLKHADQLDAVPQTADNAGLRAAYEVADRYGWTPEELVVYDYWSMKAQDERGALEVAEQRGEQRGIAQGRQEEKRVAARAMLADGLPVETIIKYTGLSSEEVAKLGKS